VLSGGEGIGGKRNACLPERQVCGMELLKDELVNYSNLLFTGINVS
tara:strand:- start:436 stop:573 length:138 start_codon:yes stop_codon:yes gene_type:complete